MENITFEWRDEFSRQNIAQNIITLIDSPAEISPFVIDGGWGTGKTEFSLKLCNLLKNEDKNSVVYIDAFKTDHANEPLLSVMAEILKLVPEKSGQRQRVINKILPAVRFGLKASLKAGVSHILRQDTDKMLDEFDKDIQNATDSAIEASVESLLKSHIEAEASMNALQDTLRSISRQKPIVVIIDELDRCKPDYAVNMLEVIKHTFSVENVQFLLVTNTKQLQASVEHCYGNRVAAEKYLDKFINYRLTLPKLLYNAIDDAGNSRSVSYVYYRKRVIESDVLQNTCLNGQYREQFFNLAQQALHCHDTSLRDVEAIVRHLEVLHTLNDQIINQDKIFGYSMLYLTAVLMAVLEPVTADKMLINQATASEVGLLYGVPKIPELEGQLRRRPKHYEVFTVLIAQECINSDIYIPSQENEQIWDEMINGMFQRGFRPDNTLRTVTEVIKHVQLHS